MFYNSQSTIIFIITSIALVLAYTLTKEKYKNLATLITGITLALVTMKFADYNDAQALKVKLKADSLQKVIANNVIATYNVTNDFKNQVTGGNAIPVVFVTASRFSNGIKSQDSFVIRFDVGNKSNYALNNLNFSLVDDRGAYISQFYKVKVFLHSFETINTNISDTLAYKEYNSNISEEIKRIDVGGMEPVYVTAIPTEVPPNFYGTPDKYFYPITIKWLGGSIYLQLHFQAAHNKLTLVKMNAWLNNKNVDAKNLIGYSYFD